VLSNSIQRLLLVITNGRQEVHARTLTSVCKSGIEESERVARFGKCYFHFAFYSSYADALGA